MNPGTWTAPPLRRLLLATLVLAGVVLATACASDGSDADGDDADGSMSVTEVWARATAGNPGENTAIYAHIENLTGAADTLVRVEVPAEVAMAAEVHQMVQQGDNMMMQELEGGLDLPVNGHQHLEPGGFHVMVMGVAEQLQPGQTFPATFIFEHAGPVEVTVEVREASAMGDSTSP